MGTPSKIKVEKPLEHSSTLRDSQAPKHCPACGQEKTAAAELAVANHRIDRLSALNGELVESLKAMVRYDDLPEAEQQPAVEKARALLSKVRNV